MNLTSVTGWLVLALVIWSVIEEPARAARVVRSTGAFLSSAAHGMTTFLASL